MDRSSHISPASKSPANDSGAIITDGREPCNHGVASRFGNMGRPDGGAGESRLVTRLSPGGRITAKTIPS
jgi:hypothetical protein